MLKYREKLPSGRSPPLALFRRQNFFWVQERLKYPLDPALCRHDHRRRFRAANFLAFPMLKYREKLPSGRSPPLALFRRQNFFWVQERLKYPLDPALCRHDRRRRFRAINNRLDLAELKISKSKLRILLGLDAMHTIRGSEKSAVRAHKA
jgi:hypothetical protein